MPTDSRHYKSTAPQAKQPRVRGASALGGNHRHSTLATSLREGRLGIELDPVAGVGRLCRVAVRRGVVGRPSPAVSEPAVAATGGLQPGPGRLLLLVDLLRRGRQRGAPRHRLPADLPGPAAAVRVRLADHRTPGTDRAQPEHGLHRRLHFRPLWPLAAAGGDGGGDRADRRDPLRGPAVQGGGDEPVGAGRTGPGPGWPVH